jgi:hypothetical protein
MGSALADTAASLAVFAQDAPARLQQEITLFWQEVELEAQRLDRGANGPTPADGSRAPVPAPGSAGPDSDSSPQEQIDQLRARVAELARRLETSAP